MEGSGSNALRPREPSELLGETLRVYQRNFWPFAAIAFIAHVPLLLAAVTPSRELAFILSNGAIPLSFLGQGATVYAVVHRYLGRSIFVLDCYARAWRKGLPLIIGGLLFAGVLFILVVLSRFLIGIPLLFYFLVSWFFFIPIIMMEGRDPLAALERSRRLVAGSWWRTFGIGVLFVLPILALAWLILVSVGTVLAIISVTLRDISTVLVSIVLTPVGTIGATLVYFDLRVRREGGYTLEQMATESGP